MKIDSVTLGMILRNIGLVYSCLHNYDKSIHYFGQALQILPDNVSLLFRYGEVYYQQYLEQSHQSQQSSSALSGSERMRSNPFVLLRDGLVTFSTSQSSSIDLSLSLTYLFVHSLIRSTADALFARALKVLDSRSDPQHSLSVFCLLRRAVIALGMNK